LKMYFFIIIGDERKKEVETNHKECCIVLMTFMD